MYRYIFLFLILFSPLLSADNLIFDFRWLNISVAKFVLSDNIISRNSENTEFKITTKGPLKLYRNYSSSGYIKKTNDYNWEYYLSGIDRGIPEEKQIFYFAEDYPIIKKFVDDDGYPEILIDKVADIGVIDPFTVLLNTLANISKNKNCDSIYSVMDGKRRYKINVKLLNIDQINNYNQLYHCRFYLYEVHSQLLNVTKKNKWPFKKNDKNKRFIDIWFSGSSTVIPERFEIHTPIGKIIGKIKK